MKRYEKFVIEVEMGITIKISEGTNGELVISTKNSVNPPIPEGYKHVCGEWNNGLVIERYSDRSQFVWIPVKSLDNNGTLDGEHFSEKFGRRNFKIDKVSNSDFCEPLNDEFLEQIESVKKYGGFYISRYQISKTSKGKPQSVKGVLPWRMLYFDEAKEVAATFEDSEDVKSHLPFGAEYDSVLEWFIKTKIKTRDEIEEDSTEWGNYATYTRAELRQRRWGHACEKILETGSREEWSANNIYDLSGNGQEWTQEKCRTGIIIDDYPVVRGGNERYPYVTNRECESDIYREDNIVFRVALYIK